MSNPFADEEGPQPPRVLKAPVEICANLKVLKDNRIPLIMRFKERTQCFQTFLVDLNRESGWIALDELIPNDGERFMANGEAFEIEGYYEGVRIAWENDQPTRVGELEGARCFWSPLPKQAIYHQRRNAYRAVLKGQPVNGVLSGKDLKAGLQCRVLDISATGCRLCIQGDYSYLQTGQVYESLSAQLPIGRMETAVELRHVQFDDKRSVTLCGARFYRMNGLLQRQIERLVNQLQREARQDGL